MEKYIFSEDILCSYPELFNKTFAKSQLLTVYNSIIDKEEYTDFGCWLSDMLKHKLIIIK